MIWADAATPGATFGQAFSRYISLFALFHQP
jgi:hypothetical protein